MVPEPVLRMPMHQHIFYKRLALDREPVLHGLHGDLFLPQCLHGQDGGVGGLERGGV